MRFEAWASFAATLHYRWGIRLFAAKECYTVISRIRPSNTTIESPTAQQELPLNAWRAANHSALPAYHSPEKNPAAQRFKITLAPAGTFEDGT